jgi:galactokinase/mevalonate kinase-like predicted kinase
MLEEAEPEAAAALITSVSKLRQREQKDQDIAIKKWVLEQNSLKLALEKQQFRMRACELFMERYEDKRVKAILDGKETRSVKLDQLSLALFGEKPEGLEFGQ